MKKAGFTLLEEAKKTYRIDVDGMTCSSCSAALEHALNKAEGISAVSINLVTNTATVEADPHKIKLSEILAIIQNTGYHGTLHVERKEEAVKKDSTSIKIYTTLALAFILLYIGMSHMLGNIRLPLPDIIHYDTHPFHFALIQFLLATSDSPSGTSFLYQRVYSIIPQGAQYGYAGGGWYQGAPICIPCIL